MCVSSLFLISCSDEISTVSPSETGKEQSTPIVLGDKPEIPFSIENMQKALNKHAENLTTIQLNSSAPNYNTNGPIPISGYQITPTHHYYRFKPKDSLQLETLLQDTVLNVSDIPFEYDVQTNGENYVDPAFDGSSYPYTYFYSVAPINYNLPAGIPVTTISKLHFTREDEIPDNPTPAEEDSLRF